MEHNSLKKNWEVNWKVKGDYTIQTMEEALLNTHFTYNANNMLQQETVIIATKRERVCNYRARA